MNWEPARFVQLLDLGTVIATESQTDETFPMGRRLEIDSKYKMEIERSSFTPGDWFNFQNFQINAVPAEFSIVDKLEAHISPANVLLIRTTVDGVKRKYTYAGKYIVSWMDAQ